MEVGKYYIFKFRQPRGGFAAPPDTKAKLIEESNTAYKVDVDGDIATWDKMYIREAVPIHAGGKRKTRKAHRKSSRKAHRKVHRKSHRKSHRKGSRRSYRK